MVQGTSSIAAGESILISNNPQKFLVDYPAYVGTLVKSAFSLINTGESLTLKDNALAALDTVTYSSSMGAAGDGNSLHLTSTGAWVPGAPNPGSSAPTQQIVKAAPVVASTSVKASAKISGKKSTSSHSSNTFNDISQSAAAITSEASAPRLPNIPPLYLYLLGLVALIGLGVAAVLYVRGHLNPFGAEAAAETEGAAEEFDIE